MRCRTIILFVVVAPFIGVASADAGSADDFRAKRHKTAQVPKSPRPRSPDPCLAYGPGFVRIEGTGTCVKIGGSIGIGGSVSSNPMAR